jgi:S1-C subfamily serine protease
MRKSIVISLMVLVALATTAGAIFAQDTTAAATAWLGVAVVEQNDQVVVTRVQTGSPADAAGVLIGDAITAFNGTAIASPADLREQVQAASAGVTVKLDLVRDGETMSVDVTLVAAPGRGQAQPVDALTLAERLLRADLQAADGGFEVVNVLKSDNPFELAVGDVVASLNGQNITELSVDALRKSMRDAQQPGLTLEVTRDGQQITLEGNMLGMPFGFGRGPDGRGDFGGFGGRGNGRPGQPGQPGQQGQPGQPGQPGNPPPQNNDAAIPADGSV